MNHETPVVERSVWRKFMETPAVMIDGGIYALIAFFGAWSAGLGSDEAAKHIPDTMLFWMRNGCASIAAMLLAVKMFRSQGYAYHVEEKKVEKAEEKAEEKKKSDTLPPFKPSDL